MKVRNASQVEACFEHSVRLWPLLSKGEAKTVEHVEEFIAEKELEIHESKIPAEEFYYILSGYGIMIVGDEEVEVGPGDLIYIPAGAKHGLRVKGSYPVRALAWKSPL